MYCVDAWVLTRIDAYDVIGAITMSRPMGLLEQGKDVDDMLSEIKIEGDYRAVVSLATRYIPPS